MAINFKKSGCFRVGPRCDIACTVIRPISSNGRHLTWIAEPRFTRFIWWMQRSAQVAVNPQTKPRDLGCESACRQLSSTTTIAIYYYYSARKL